MLAQSPTRGSGPDVRSSHPHISSIRPGGGTLMRYGSCRSARLLDPKPFLAEGVPTTTLRASLVAKPRSANAIAPRQLSAGVRAVAIPSIAACADPHYLPTASAVIQAVCLQRGHFRRQLLDESPIARHTPRGMTSRRQSTEARVGATSRASLCTGWRPCSRKSASHQENQIHQLRPV